MELTETETRVLGALMEKAKTTPDIYPLTLNALVHACNQKTSRDPVTDYEEETVISALDSLREKQLVMRVDMAGSRTAKFRENATSHWQLSREEYALLTVLLLRGPQTAGQLRARTERLYPFAEIPQVNEWLKSMEQREEEPHVLVQSRGRRPGSKEIRYAHTLQPVAEQDRPAFETASSGGESLDNREEDSKDRMESLESSVRQLEERVQRLEALLDDLTN